MARRARGDRSLAAALNDFAAAPRDLNEAGIRYVVVGGLAVIRHGAVRATKDVHAAVSMDDDNLAHILSAQLLPAPFDAVRSRSDIKRIDGVEAPVCSLADLVAMKRAAGRTSDQLDLERLRDAHGVLPEDPPTP